MTNIAILTTWQSACGIAEYSRKLVDELKILDHKIIILSNKDGYIQGKTYDDTYIFSTKVFGVSWWGEDPSFNSDKAWEEINRFENLYGQLDTLIIQYQSSLYADSGFNEFLSKVKNATKIIIVQHDSSLNPKHKFPARAVFLVHNESIPHDYYIPFPTIETTPKVFSFGMGERNDYEFIKKSCNEIGVNFESHDARKNGWLTEEVLFEKMNNADAIVLWYNDVPIQGQSSALRTAISSMRPVIVNDIPWFADAPDFVIKVTPKDISKEFTAKAALQATLRDILRLKYIRQHSFKRLAEKHMEIYNGR